MEREMLQLFVPGRICLFGEHSDWAAGYRKTNPDIEKGYTIIGPTNQGIHARIRRHPDRLFLHCCLDDGTRMGPISLPMVAADLEAEASGGGFFSYAAGVASEMLRDHPVGGLELDNHRTDLPIRKGLSSSAAFCVLVARAFNRIYGLGLSVEEEMEYAYRGERLTGSQCGRMDQACAHGSTVMMVFDADGSEIRPLSVGAPLHFVIVDLQASKDTRRILAALNRCYPDSPREAHRLAREYLGPLNARITLDAEKAIADGDIERLGQLMVRAQSAFDLHLQPVCPDQLTAPVLHRLLEHPAIQPHVLGGKGVGSQGDGAAQLLVRDEKSAETVREIIERELSMTCLSLTLRPTARITKAVIPVAGHGTRMFPATKAVKKEFFPVIGTDGRCRPAILHIVEEAFEAGIEEICLIVKPGDREDFDQFFRGDPPSGLLDRLSDADRRYCRYLKGLGERISYVVQEIQEGLGHALLCARDWIGNEPFLFLLGDHLYRSAESRNCARQVVDCFHRRGRSVVGIRRTPLESLGNYGCVRGTWIETDVLLSIDRFAEKPTREYALEHLSVPGGGYYSLFGIYALTPTIFQYLESHVDGGHRLHGEFQLTSCLDDLREIGGVSGLAVRGRNFDIGVPLEYRHTLVAFSGSEIDGQRK